MRQPTSYAARRQFERYFTKANAFVHYRNQFQPAKVVDYSAGGLQLAGTFGLIKPDLVEIEFISGVRVPAYVAWSLGAQTGIAYTEPLPIDHPALIDLARRAGITIGTL